ncbi:hypothetical protein BS78_03G198400 [Paspalum vaginatum]|nr:hypothetical protein BS78_03G198400 [Paspalum vaginatum]
MSRKHHGQQERAGGSGSGASSKAVWDTGSSLYDSYELAAVRRLLDRRLLAVAGGGGGVLPLHGEPSSAAEARDKKKQAVAAGVRRKVTLRALFRAVATWAARPRQAPLACACAGMVHDQTAAAVEPDVPSHGHL